MKLAELEAEILLLGIWKNVADLEENLSLPELQAIVEASREREHRDRKFAAALKGVDLDEQSKQDAKERFEKVQRRVQARRTGVDEKQLEMDVFGLDIEVEN